MRETDVQRAVVGFYRQVGGVVYDLAQGYRPGGRRHGTTRQTKGLPDLWVFFPHLGLVLWHEVKAVPRSVPEERRPDVLTKKQTAEQRTFQKHCEEVRMPYVLGGLPEAVRAITVLRAMRKAVTVA
jgi:hypothetical protein